MIEEHNAFSGEGKVDPEGMKVAVELLKQGAALKNPKPWDAYVDLSFYERAKAELGK